MLLIAAADDLDDEIQVAGRLLSLDARLQGRSALSIGPEPNKRSKCPEPGAIDLCGMAGGPHRMATKRNAYSGLEIVRITLAGLPATTV